MDFNAHPKSRIFTSKNSCFSTMRASNIVLISWLVQHLSLKRLISQQEKLVLTMSFNLHYRWTYYNSQLVKEFSNKSNTKLIKETKKYWSMTLNLVQHKSNLVSQAKSSNRKIHLKIYTVLVLLWDKERDSMNLL